jgi:hypothetical protein
MITEEKAQVHHHADCVCCRTSDAIGRVMSAFGPSGDAREHFRQSRVEFLKGIRKIIDDRIEKVSRAPQPKGSRIVVE